MFLWRKIIESTVDGFSVVLRSLVVRPTALNTLSLLLLLLAGVHSTDLANFSIFGQGWFVGLPPAKYIHLIFHDSCFSVASDFVILPVSLH